MTPELQLAHPVADADALGDQPLRVTLLDRHWVLWRDAQGRPRAAPDACPHRGAPLSAGRVQDGLLQCPYHGWRFDAEGRCVQVPALPQQPVPAGYGLACATLVDARGLLWLQPAGGAPRLPAFAAEDDAGLRRLNVGPFDVASSAPRVVENFLDQAHFGFVHGGLLGDAAQGAVPLHEARVTPEGVQVRGCRAWQPRSNLTSAAGCWVDYAYDVPAPYTAVLHKRPEDGSGWHESIALHICPVRPEQSRVWFRLAVPPAADDDAALRAFQRDIFLQDQPIVEAQQPRLLPLQGELHTAADRASVAYRRWLRDSGVRFGTC